MAQQRVFMGSVTAAIPNGGDETHPIYVREGKAYQIDKVAEASHADKSSEADHAANSDEATHAGVSDKLGEATVGGPNTPIYLKDGVPTPIEVSFGDSTSSEIVLGDGSTLTIDKFIENNIEKIRETLGIVTKEKSGLVPKLPDQQ